MSNNGIFKWWNLQNSLIVDSKDNLILLVIAYVSAETVGIVIQNICWQFWISY
jgi:hypothetical protein